MTLTKQVCSPDQALELDAFGFTTKDSLFAWVVDYESRRGYVQRTNKLYLKSVSMGASILLHTETGKVKSFTLRDGMAKVSKSGPAFTVAELGMMLGPSIEFAAFYCLEGERPKWGYKNDYASMFGATEAEARANILIGGLETERFTVDQMRDCLNYQ